MSLVQILLIGTLQSFKKIYEGLSEDIFRGTEKDLDLVFLLTEIIYGNLRTNGLMYTWCHFHFFKFRLPTTRRNMSETFKARLKALRDTLEKSVKDADAVEKICDEVNKKADQVLFIPL